MSQDEHPATVYARDVVAGRIVAGAPVRHACQRHLDDLAASTSPDYPFCFDAAVADDVLDFCRLCLHFEGEWEGRPFEPEPWQVFVLASIFGWLRRSDTTRRYRKAFILVARKNGKTFLAAVIALFMLTLDGEAGAQVINFANALDQARILHRAGDVIRSKSPALARRVQNVKDNMSVTSTASFWRPLANDASHWDGLNAHCGLCDELHEHDGHTYHVVESSMGARRQPLMLSISTAGFNHEAFGGEMYDYFKAVVDPKSSVRNEEAFAYVAELDDDDDPLDDAVWVKANPNLGVSVKLDYLRGEAQKARDLARALNNFLTKHVNRWTTQRVRWLPMDRWDECPGVVDVKTLEGKRCIAGLDLSTNWDLTALALVFFEVDPMVVLVWYWLPEENLRPRVDHDRVPYDLWVKAGWIELTPGNVVDYDFIELRVLQEAARFEIVEVAYDPYKAMQVATHLQAAGLQPVRVDQNHANLHEASKRFEALVVGGRLNHAGNPVLRWNAQNVSVKRNAAGEIKPVKDDDKKRIDGVSAVVTALARVIRQPMEPPPGDGVTFHRPPSSRRRDFLEFG